MQLPTHSTANPADNGDAARRTVQIVGVWLLAALVLPPTGLLWQFDVPHTMGHWVVNHVLAALQLRGLFF